MAGKKYVKLFLSAQFLCLQLNAGAVENRENFSFPQLKKLMNQGAKVSAVAWSLDEGLAIGNLNGGDHLTPASITKLIIAASALEEWGANHRFTTQMFYTGNFSNGVIDGDLIFEGSGDPYLTNEILWGLTTDVARAGVKRVKGKLRILNGRFAEETPDENRMLAENGTTHAYDSPLSAAAVNFSVVAAVAHPGASNGAPAQIALEPYPLDSVSLGGKVTTTSQKGKINASRTTRSGKNFINVTGSVGLKNPGERVYRSISDADTYTASVLRAFLKSSGISIESGNSIERVTFVKNAKLLVEATGYPINWQLRGLQTMSNNFIADMLTLNLDAESSKKAGSLSSGAKLLENYLKKVVQQYPQLPTTQISKIQLLSGSGLTPENKISASEMIGLLHHMYFQSKHFPAFLAALPMPGDDGTLKKRFASKKNVSLASRLYAKTGTLSDPVDAVSLAGYYRNDAGKWFAFCAIVNGSSSQKHFGIEALRNAIDQDLLALAD